MDDEDINPPCVFQKIVRASEKAKNHFKTDKDSSCGDKKKLSHAAARRCASRHIGRAYKCKYCGRWHFSATDIYKDGK